MKTFSILALKEPEKEENWRDFFDIEPIVSLSSDAIVGYEILRRPAPFSQSKRQWSEWYDRVARFFLSREAAEKITDVFPYLSREIFVTINLDDWQFMDSPIMNSVIESLLTFRRAGIVPAIEWTERGGSDRNTIGKISKILETVRLRTQALVVFDDMGAGVDYNDKLAMTRPDIGKIAGTIFHDSHANHRSRTSASKLVDLLHEIGARSVVEWVETNRDLALARAIGAHYGQGYLWSKSNWRAPIRGHGGEILLKMGENHD